MQAILTRYHGPTNFRGSRISAQADSKRIYLPYDYALNIDQNHIAAAKAYADSLGWLCGTPEQPTRQRWELISGQLHTGDFAHTLRALPDAIEADRAEQEEALRNARIEQFGHA